MCTAVMFCGDNHIFGRNLDLSYHYSESVTITPHRFPLKFSDGQRINSHYAMIGVATVVDNYPLYYDAVNECGLCIAALNFPGNAVYREPRSDMINVASYELIPWILSQYTNVGIVKQALYSMNITNRAFNTHFQPTPLHWMIADKDSVIVLESTTEGIKVYDNPVKVLTNNPPFPFHIYNLNNYLNLSAMQAKNQFNVSLNLQPYSLGMGSIGLPGDLSSASRFVRAAFHLHNGNLGSSLIYNINQIFRILNSVSQLEGSVDDCGKWVKTVYTCCCDATRGIYYYTTYENSQVTAVSMKNEAIDSQQLTSHPLRTKQNYFQEN